MLIRPNHLISRFLQKQRIFILRNQAPDFLATETVQLRQQGEAQAAAMAADAAAHRSSEQQVAAANIAAAAAAAMRDAAQKYSDAAEAAAESAAAARSAMLTENPLAGLSAADPNRVRVDHWKGMSAAQRAAFPLGQLQQISDRAAQHQVGRFTHKRYVSSTTWLAVRAVAWLGHCMRASNLSVRSTSGTLHARYRLTCCVRQDLTTTVSICINAGGGTGGNAICKPAGCGN